MRRRRKSSNCSSSDTVDQLCSPAKKIRLNSHQLPGRTLPEFFKRQSKSSADVNTGEVSNVARQPPPQAHKEPDATTVSCSSLVHDPSRLIVANEPKCVPYSKPLLGLSVDYYPRFFKPAVATDIFRQLEKELVPYLEKSKNEVKIMGKVHKIPRKQAAFGDEGLSYNFSGVSVPADPWISPLSEIRSKLLEVVGVRFNFVLVNRYKDGGDHIGEHRDDEKDLVPQSPIASVSLGQDRDFVFKHRDARGKDAKRKDIETVRIHLEHGSLLMMKYPTNTYWYHSLPVRKAAARPRINLTFRQMKL